MSFRRVEPVPTTASHEDLYYPPCVYTASQFYPEDYTSLPAAEIPHTASLIGNVLHYAPLNWSTVFKEINSDRWNNTQTYPKQLKNILINENSGRIAGHLATGAIGYLGAKELQDLLLSKYDRTWPKTPGAAN